VAILGTPGAGKSTLLKHLCRHPVIAERFVDGVLWKEIGHSPSPAVLKGWCEQLFDPRLPSDKWTRHNWEEEIKPQFNGRVADLKLLLVLDDIWTLEDARTFATDLGGPKCVTLVSTRFDGAVRELIPASQCHRVRNMTAPEAMDLFKYWAEDVYREFPKECKRLIDWLERLPLTVRVAAGLLASVNRGQSDRRKVRVAQLLEEITNSSRLIREKPPSDVGEKSVGAVVEKTLDYLTDQARKRFLELGVIEAKPATFDGELVAALWEIRLESAEATLSELENFGLLEHRAEDGRYYMHALLRDYANASLRRLATQ
jgi:hypothetical protein